MDELLRDFLTETNESIDVVDVELVRFEQEPNNAQILGRIFRLVHTIKGTCGFLSLPRLEALTHAAETLIGNFRDFFPRVPAGGLAPDAKWTDTTSVTDQGAGSSVTVTSLNHTSVGRWADRDGTRCLELDVQSTFTLSGNGQQNGQNFTLAGSGVRNGVDYVSVDGRYVGGTAGDSTSYTVSLQALGQVVPVVQTTQTTIVVIR